MKLEILDEKVNRLLYRTELDCKVEFEGPTPSRLDIIKEIASKKHVDEKLVVLDSVEQEFGKQECRFQVRIYESEKARKRVEGKEKKVKKLERKEKPTEVSEEAPQQEEKKQEGEENAQEEKEENEKNEKK